MKILYLTNIPYPYKVTFYNMLALNNDLTVVYNGAEDYKRNPLWFKNNKPTFKEKYLKNSSYFRLIELLNKHYDAIILGYYASFMGVLTHIILKIRKIKYFIHADGGIVDSQDTFITKFLKTFFISKASYYLSSGNKTNEYLIHYGANPNNIFTYPFTSLLEKDILDTPIKYEEKMTLRRNKGYDYKRLFVSVGSFIKIKGYDLFFESIKNIDLKDTGFLIIGGGDKKNNYLSVINKYKIDNVHLIDFCSKEEVFDYLKMSDIFFFPTRRDTWGLVINEAMACGLPIISSNNAVAAIELLDNKYLYPPQDIQKQRDLLEYMFNLSNNDLYKIGNTNLNKIRKYTIENMTKTYNEILINNKLK